MIEYKKPKYLGLKKDEFERIATEFAEKHGFKIGNNIRNLVTSCGGEIKFLDYENWIKSKDGSII
ncbi:MAG: hypothetical protein HPY53_09720, partial [Brevinematales bacterium]|nr:hypothetical protein [Brevinematales bacterium]